MELAKVEPGTLIEMILEVKCLVLRNYTGLKEFTVYVFNPPPLVDRLFTLKYQDVVKVGVNVNEYFAMQEP